MQERALYWVQSHNISARSALVTILGDTITPLGGTVWLKDLIEMAALFGFSERLVRTSMFRLVADGWVQSERIGRRSQYSLTPFGVNEFSNAEARIYQREEPVWDGDWTLVFIPNPNDADQQLVQHLRWRGFAELSRGVHASPTKDVAAIAALVEHLDVEAPALASARFADIAPITSSSAFRDKFGLARTEAAYRRFSDDHEWARSLSTTDLTDSDAFIARTLVMHDWRRVRLGDPDLPRDLLPAEWAGDAAMDLAAEAYQATSAGAWRFAEATTGMPSSTGSPSFTMRFGHAQATKGGVSR